MNPVYFKRIGFIMNYFFLELLPFLYRKKLPQQDKRQEEKKKYKQNMPDSGTNHTIENPEK